MIIRYKQRRPQFVPLYFVEDGRILQQFGHVRWFPIDTAINLPELELGRAWGPAWR